MNPIRLIQKTNHRQLIIELPEEFVDRQVEIIILPADEPVITTPDASSRLATVRQFAGIAKHNLPVEEDEYYNQ